ncbi:MAG TPA: tryptophan 7-halogenase [Gammaproteobacteria bacterium]|nr:tryptophan 7-halogenase [Gammaproteobacteria bacterium]
MLVIVGGPAGATVSSLLVEEGWNVALLEKEHHPRFHIGESLLAMNLPILKRLGVLEQMAAIGVPKYGVYFLSHQCTDHDQIFYFSRALDKNYPHAHEVRRSEFDHLLLKTAMRRA